GERQIRPAHAAPGVPQPLEGLRARHLVDEVPVDIDEAGAVLAALDDVGVPDLLVERPWLHAVMPRLTPTRLRTASTRHSRASIRARTAAPNSEQLARPPRSAVAMP